MPHRRRNFSSPSKKVVDKWNSFGENWQFSISPEKPHKHTWIGLVLDTLEYICQLLSKYFRTIEKCGKMNKVPQHSVEMTEFFRRLDFM